MNSAEKATPIIGWTAGSSPAPTAFAGHINRDVKTKPRYMASLRACYEHDKGRKRKEAVTGDRTSPTEDTMPDITMCLNSACPLRHGCHRYTSLTNEQQWVSMYRYEKTIMKNGGVVETIYDCDHFIDNKPYIHQTK